MATDFSNLSPADFEDLSRDLIGQELKVRFEAFAAGPDGGIDGRHAPVGGSKIILQAKHYAGSRISHLQRVMKKERTAIDRLEPDRYILSTSRPLTPRSKGVLAKIIGPALNSEDDIFGPDDLGGLLRKHPEVEKAHIKLWLSSAAVIEKILHAATHSFTATTRADIEARVKLYAANPSLEKARQTLEANHVVIVAGPPGVGKTTLAEMLAFAYMAEDWRLVAIRSLDDGYASIDDTKRQIFFFDDFLGRVSLSREQLSRTDSDLARFLSRVRKSKNARFILTTRAYILEEARQFSEHLADKRIEISRFVLDVGHYTRRIRARILYNHLLMSPTPQPLVEALVHSGQVKAIVDHKNYNPRIIEWMTDEVHLADATPETYVGQFLNLLANPKALWEIAFRNLPPRYQHLLIVLFFSSQYGVELNVLRASYDPLHEVLGKHFNTPLTPHDFEEAIKTLEGGFLSIANRQVSFINPSVRDFLTDYLQDMRLLGMIARVSVETEYANAVWRHINKISGPFDDLSDVAAEFAEFALALPNLPTLTLVEDGHFHSKYWTPFGLSVTARVSLLLSLWNAAPLDVFSESALKVVIDAGDRMDPMRDGQQPLELVHKLRDGDYYPELGRADEIASALEEAVVEMVEAGGLATDEIETISNSVEEYSRSLGARLKTAIAEAILLEIRSVDESVNDIDSESTLQDKIETLVKLAKRAPVPEEYVRRASELINERISYLRNEAPPETAPQFKGPMPEAVDLSDIELRDLFASLTVAER